MLDWTVLDPACEAQSLSLHESTLHAQLGQPASHDVSMRDGTEALLSDISTTSGSPIANVLTPSSSNDARAVSAQMHDSIAPLCGEYAAPLESARGKGCQTVLESYMGRELARLGNADSFGQHYKQFAEYQQALHSLELPEAQKKAAAKLITAFGDSSALLLLKSALLNIQDGGHMPVKGLSIPDRLRVISSLECSAENTRLIYWLHLYEMLQDLSRQLEAEDVGNEPSSDARGQLKKFGNPQNQRQSRISQLMLANMPSGYATDTKTKRLRRIAQRLLLLVEQWNGYGVIALLGAGFNTSEMMLLSDAQGYAYSTNPYAQQHAQYDGTVQYTVPPQDHTPYYPSIAPTAPQALTAANAQLPVQQIQQSPSTARPTALQPTASTIQQAPENSVVAQPTASQSPHGSHFADNTLADTFDGQEQHDDDQDETDDGPVFHLPPPPEATYSSVEELDKAIHAWSLEHGYELVRRASKKNAKGILYKRYYHCSKHGKLANTGKLTDATRVRINRKSNRINCPMSLAIVAVDPNNPNGQWQVRHRKTHHNHGPLDALALAGHRRRARVGGVEKAVDGLFAIGTPTTQVLQFLQRTNPNGLFTRTDVANMKLKYKKFGTCIDRREPAPPESRPGLATACQNCRTRKTKCDSLRPVCTNCIQLNQLCDYTFDPAEQESSVQGASTTETLATPVQAAVPNQAQPNTGAPSTTRTEAILADLQTFQEVHVKPVRLSLQSSTVEVLAASSCGNGDSFRNIPPLETVEQWMNFRNAVCDASMKENMYEVLVGVKLEPVRPSDNCSVEEWNEYVKQLAIFVRRNTALMGAILPRLAPQFRQRVQYARLAYAIWSVLEEVCLPRGSEIAYRAYLDLHSITLQNSKDLKDYIMRIEAAYNAMNRVTHTPSELAGEARRALHAFDPSRDVGGALPTTTKRQPASNVVTEEMLMFLFLKGLGPDFKRLIDNLCSTGNIGGFGTGRRLGFVDLTRRAIEFQNMQARRHEGEK
ncbi:hypothetical protein AMS68_002304 [Peltaster fructicola]|uniref:Zn(2)-C6 fungal-type domain-containing protein n=1 Tax=Peltaster fructicola TaxID=286661 RepID=A0A6H0XPU9_9PEZI|nr:hypothetical protein AMS68_002304 [Peltaster fructicola]